MTLLYKLTDKYNKTRPGMTNECLWGPEVSHSGTGKGELCSSGYIHAYLDPLLAVFLNPIHANYSNPRLWLAEGEISLREGDLKVGCKSLKTLREIKLPTPSPEQHACFAIYAAMEVYKDPSFTAWALEYLSGQNRTAEAARAARAAAWAAAWAAEAAAWAAEAAAWAAEAAAEAAEAAARAAADEPKSFLIECARKAYLPNIYSES